MDYSVNERIKFFLDHNGLTQYRLGKIIGVQAHTINRIVNRNNGVSVDTLSKICQNFPNLNLNWLIAGEGNIIQKRRNTRAYKG